MLLGGLNVQFSGMQCASHCPGDNGVRHKKVRRSYVL